MTKDRFHSLVKNALIKEGWAIMDDPYRVKVGEVKFEIDLAAEMLIAAERQGEKIAVEVKSFLGSSSTYEFHTAIGQYVNYHFMLRLHEPEGKLYLAIPEDTYESFLPRLLFKEFVKKLVLIC
ncbi:MAG: XisH family protein [Deinococcales bacterium]